MRKKTLTIVGDAETSQGTFSYALISGIGMRYIFKLFYTSQTQNPVELQQVCKASIKLIKNIISVIVFKQDDDHILHV